MTDPINITDRLPPEVRKPWRRQLPENYAKHIDELLALPNEIRAIRRRLGELKDAIGTSGIDAQVALDQLAKAIVLLECAEEAATYTVPTEEFMPKESIREFWS